MLSTPEYGQWNIVDGIDRQLLPTDNGPWTIVHGIDIRVWSTES